MRKKAYIKLSTRDRKNAKVSMRGDAIELVALLCAAIVDVAKGTGKNPGEFAAQMAYTIAEVEGEESGVSE